MTTPNPFEGVTTINGTPTHAPDRLTVDYIPKYVAHMVAEGRATGTVDKTQASLVKFARYVPTIDSPWSAIQGYLDTMRDLGYVDSTIGLHLTHVKTFYKWLADERHLPMNPFKSNQLLRAPKKADIDVRAGGFTSHEIAKMRQAVDDIERYGSKYLRSEATLETRLVFMLALTTGMRLGEFQNIRLSHFEVRDDVWWLNVEKAKWREYGRYIRIERETSFVLIDFVNLTKAKRARVIDRVTGIDDYLFVGGTRASVRNRLAERLGTIMRTAQTTHDSKGRQRQLFHAFRKTAISHAANHGAKAGEIESAYGVGAKTAQKHYINPTLNQRQNHAAAAAEELVAAAMKPVDAYERDIWSPFAGLDDRVPYDVE